MVHRAVAEEFLPVLKARLDEEAGGDRADKEACALVDSFCPGCRRGLGENIWIISFSPEAGGFVDRPLPISTAIIRSIPRRSLPPIMPMPGEVLK